MNVSRVARRARALIVYKLKGFDPPTPEWLVDVLERMPGVTSHTADQAVAMALNSKAAAKATAEATAKKKQIEYFSDHPKELKAAILAHQAEMEKRFIEDLKDLK